MSRQPGVETGTRFPFGANWTRFLRTLDEERIVAAQSSLQEMLRLESLEGLRFLDIGSGSGLFSLAARQLGAEVHSFDFDAKSVACTQELRRRFFADDSHWHIAQASVLERRYLEGLGRFDVVYSWGVLHHTGAMWLALENTLSAVAEGGLLFIATYNDQGAKSHLWWLIKYCYNKIPRFFRPLFTGLVAGAATLLSILKNTLLLRPTAAIAPLLRSSRGRG